MSVRFQADADLNQMLVKAVLRREPRIDFQSAFLANLAGLNDSEVLAYAARENRVLVTHDRRTMPTHFAEYIQASTSAGVIVVSQNIAVRQFLDDLILIWVASEPEEWENRIAALPI